MNRIRLFAVVALLTAITFTISGSSAQDAPDRPDPEPFAGWNQRIADTHLDFRHYYPLAEVYATCRMFAERFPELCSIEEIGRSFQDRPLLALTLNNAGTGEHLSKPGMYIDANIHGNETQGTEIIILTIWHLLRNYGADDRWTDLVDTRAFYFVPVVNPDSRYHWFRDPATPHSMRHNWRPYDNDFDGRLDEDGYDDLDGDGRILMMRQKDPNGDYVLDRDKRIMVRKAPDQPGEYRLWRTEGIDNDGDGRINEDGPGGVDLNRNFPASWKPRYRQYGSGDFPCSEPEIRACVDYMLARPNIAGMQFYHNAARMILRPPGSSSDAGVVPRGDIGTWDELGKAGMQILPTYRYLQTHDGLYAAHGTQIDFGYLGLGRFAFTNELWGRAGEDLNHDGRVDQLEIRKWHDAFAKDRAYHEWKPFTHPEFGEIEIGGWDQFATRMPPADLFIEEGFRNALFTLVHAESFAELVINQPTAESLGEGLYRVRFEVRNTGVMPTDSLKAVELKTDDPVRVTVTGAVLHMCSRTDESGRNVTLQHGRIDAFRVARIASRRGQWGELIVAGDAGSEITLTATHPRSVDANVTITLP